MKKKKTANLIMVLIIAAIAIAGVVTCVYAENQYRRWSGQPVSDPELKDNAVITPGQE